MSEPGESEWQTFFDFGPTAVFDFGPSLDEVSIATARIPEPETTRQETVEAAYRIVNQVSNIAAENSQPGTCLIGSGTRRPHTERRIAPRRPVEDTFANRVRSKPKWYDYLTP